MARWLLLSGVVLLLPAVDAGTADAPELSDDRGDTFVYPNAPGAGPVADAMDLVAVWLEETAATVRFTMQVVDLAGVAVTEANPAGDGRWWVEFGVVDSTGVATGTETPWEVRAFIAQGVVWETEYTLTNPEREPTPVSGGYDVASSTLWVEAPKSAMGLAQGGRLTDLFSRTGTYFPAYPMWIGDDGTEAEGVSFAVSPGEVRTTAAEAPAVVEKDRKGASAASWWMVAAAALLVAVLRRRQD